GVARAAERALAAAVAAVDVAADRLAVETERLHAAVEELGVPSDDVPRHGTDRDRALDLVEERRHGGGVGAVDAVLDLPRAQDAIGRAEARARVHDGGTADALPERQGIAGRPKAMVAPPLRYSRWTRSIGGPWKSSCVKYAPSSRTTTRSPARASSCATTAPPAPEPTMQTSAVSSTAPWTSGCCSGTRRGPRRGGTGSRQSW